MRSLFGGKIEVKVNGKLVAVGHNTASTDALTFTAMVMNGEDASTTYSPVDQICLVDSSGANQECVAVATTDWASYDDATYGNGYSVTKKFNIANSYTLDSVRIYGNGILYFGGTVTQVAVNPGDVVYVTAYITSYIDDTTLTCSGVSGCGISSTAEFNRQVAGITLGVTNGVPITYVQIRYGTTVIRDLGVTRTRTGTTIDHEATLDTPFTSATTLDNARWYYPDTNATDQASTWNVVTSWTAQDFDPDVYHTFKLSLTFDTA